MTTPMRRIRSGCCARAARGYAAAPPSKAITSRRRMAHLALSRGYSTMPFGSGPVEQRPFNGARRDGPKFGSGLGVSDASPKQCDSTACSAQFGLSLDHLVSMGEERGWHLDTKKLSRLYRSDDP